MEKIYEHGLKQYEERGVKLRDILAKEYASSRQKAKFHWLRDEDHNKKLVHATAAKKYNKLHKLEDESGVISDILQELFW